MENKNRKIILYIMPVLLLALIICLTIVILHKNNKKSQNIQTADKPTFLATFVVDGKKFKEVEIVDGYINEFPYPPDKEGYIFDFWELEGEKFNATNRLNNDVQISAKYKKVEMGSICTVIFNPDNGDEGKKVQVGTDVVLQFPKEPKKNGYQFVGWFDGEEKFDVGSKVTRDLLLVAKYEANKYTVTFNPNNGNGHIIVNTYFDSTINKPDDPIKENYLFAGWYLNNQEYNFDSKITKDITLTAKYIYTGDSIITATNNNTDSSSSNYANTNNNNNYSSYLQSITGDNVNIINNANNVITYKITLKYNNGVSNDIFINIKEGNSLNEPSNPQKPGATFIGWFEGNTKINFPIVVNRNMILEAKYTANNYNGNTFSNINSNTELRLANANLILEHITRPTNNLPNTNLRNLDADSDGKITYNDYAITKGNLEIEALSIVQTNNLLLGDFNLDGTLTFTDYHLFKLFLENPDNQMTTYIKDTMDIFDDDIIDNKDLNLLNSIITNSFTLLANEELKQFKIDNNINKSKNIIVLKTEDVITGALFDVYLVVNFDTSYNDLENVRLFSEKLLRELSKIDFSILRLLKKGNTSLILLGSYDCDNALINVGHFTYNGYCNSINRNIVISYRSYVLHNYYLPKEIIHESGHAFDFTLRHMLINDANGGITGLIDSDILHGSNELKKLFLFDNGTYLYGFANSMNPYNWFELAKLDTVNIENSFSEFSLYSIEDLQSSPHEYFAEIFKNYYYSTSTRKLIRRLAPTSYRAFETVISNIDIL